MSCFLFVSTLRLSLHPPALSYLVTVLLYNITRFDQQVSICRPSGVLGRGSGSSAQALTRGAFSSELTPSLPQILIQRFDRPDFSLHSAYTRQAAVIVGSAFCQSLPASPSNKHSAKLRLRATVSHLDSNFQLKTRNGFFLSPTASTLAIRDETR